MCLMFKSGFKRSLNGTTKAALVGASIVLLVSPSGEPCSASLGPRAKEVQTRGLLTTTLPYELT